MYTVNWDFIGKFGIERDALSGKVALVTGAARGIGEATATIMAALGAKIIIVDKLAQGQVVVDAIIENGGQAQFIECDLSDVDQLNAMIPNAVSAFGQVDILVNNALHMSLKPTVAISLEEWEKTFATNARAPFLNIKQLLPGMLERKQGVIVNITAYEGSPMATAYSGTKMALRSMAYSVAREIGQESGVSVFSYVPGIVDTPLMRIDAIPQMIEITGISEEQALEIVAQNPGYTGFMPVEHSATALVYAIVHASEYHGQVVDPFEPLDRFGVIQMPSVDPNNAESELDVSGPLSGLYIKQYLGDVTSLNHELEQRIEIRTHELAEERDRSEKLLLNILPTPIAERLKDGENMIADYFSNATVLFADIVDFTPLSANLEPQKVVEILDTVFSSIDDIVEQYELEKIKTIGDCYMAVGGIPVPQSNHAERVANAALEIVPMLSNLSKKLDIPLTTRIGLHSGDVVAGVIGQQKFIYDLWGDTVNTASRMESQGVAGKIQVTAQTQELLKDSFRWEKRGTLDIKGKGEMETWYLMGVK